MTASRSVGEQAGVGEGLRAGVRAHRDDAVGLRAEAALDDPDPAADPLVVGLDALRELVVGDDAVGLGAAEAEDAGAGDGIGLADGRAQAHSPPRISSTAAARSSGVETFAVAVPLIWRLTIPVSVPAGVSSTAPVMPRSREGVHAGVPADRERDLRDEPVEHVRSRVDDGAVGVGEQRRAPGRRGELVAVLVDPGGERLLGGLHEAGVEGAGDGEGPHPGTLRRARRRAPRCRRCARRRPPGRCRCGWRARARGRPARRARCRRPRRARPPSTSARPRTPRPSPCRGPRPGRPPAPGSSTPAIAAAASSPTECPATVVPSGRASAVPRVPPSSASRASPESSAEATSSGWVTAVSAIASASASVPRCSRSSPAASENAASRSRAPGRSSHGASIPGFWAP